MYSLCLRYIAGSNVQHPTFGTSLYMCHFSSERRVIFDPCYAVLLLAKGPPGSRLPHWEDSAPVRHGCTPPEGQRQSQPTSCLTAVTASSALRRTTLAADIAAPGWLGAVTRGSSVLVAQRWSRWTLAVCNLDAAAMRSSRYSCDGD